MALISSLRPGWLWRILVFLAGLGLYRAALFLASSDLHFILSAKNPQWRSSIVHLLWTLYMAGGLIACAGAIFDPRGRLEILSSGALSSFGACLRLWTIPFLFPLRPDKTAPVDSQVARSVPLILVAAAASVMFVAVLGPGIHLSL